MKAVQALLGVGLSLAATLAFCPALAQAPQGAAGPGSFITQTPAGAMRLSTVLGADVIGLDIHRIGDVDDALMDRDGTIRAVVIGVGGFLGIGEKRVAVPFEGLLWNTGDVSPTAGPSASVAPENAPSEARAAAVTPERMPGANVSNEVLGTTAENRSGRVDPGTGPAATSGAPPATVAVTGKSGGAVHAVVRLTKAELQNAPAFRYEPEGRGDRGPAR